MMLLDTWIKELEKTMCDLVDVDVDDRGRSKPTIGKHDIAKWDALQEAIEALEKVKEEMKE